MPTATSIQAAARDRKSTRLNSSHVAISYAVFCLKKKTFGHRTFSDIDVSANSRTFSLNDRFYTRTAAGYLSRSVDSSLGLRPNCLVFFFFLMIRRPPRSTPFPTRRSSDLAHVGRALSALTRREQTLAADMLDRLV